MAGRDAILLQEAVQALLFVSDEPVGVLSLAEALDEQAADVREALRLLQERLAGEGSGIELMEVAGGWRLVTKAAYHDVVKEYVRSWDVRRLSKAAMETLAIIAYGQPMTRQGIAQIRGVNSDSSIGSLLDKGLIREAGTAPTPGNPTLYETSRTFLEKFGLRSLDDLPDLDVYVPDEETKRFIRERLSATRISDIDFPEQPDDIDSFEFSFDEGESFVGGDDMAADATWAKELLSDALAQGVGVVEKVDFDQLVFESGDD